MAASLARRPGAAGGLDWQVISRSEVTSTNDVCRELGEAGRPEGVAVIADVQTRGRGRLGRAWASPAGCGLWCSVLLRPPLPMAALAPLALVVAVAARRAVSSSGDPGAAEVGIKWPNDLVWRRRKLAGILTEARLGPHPEQAPEYVVVGIGINLETPPDGYPPPLAGAAVSLAEVLGRRPAAGELGARVLLELGAAYREFGGSGFAGLRREWLVHNRTTGGPVTATGAGGDITAGHAEDIDLLGRLVIRRDDGERVAVAAGDVTLRRPDGVSEGREV